MEEEIKNAIITINISPIELILMTFISVIGSLIHEYVVYRNKEGISNKTMYMNIVMSTLISVIVCIVINPYIIRLFSSRMILLPPLILGLVGPELVIYMVGLKSASKVIEYVLSLIGVIKRDHVEIPSLDEVENNINTVNSKTMDDISELDINTQYLYTRITKCLNEYIYDANIDIFLNHYSRIKDDIKELKETISLYKNIPIDISLRISEILRINKELELVYRDMNNLNNNI